MKKKLVKPQKNIDQNKVILYTSESGNAGCTNCQSGCLNCGCKGRCCSE